MPTDRIEFLGVEFDQLTEQQVLDRLRSVTADTPFGYIVTPNVDHIVRLDREAADPVIDAAYARAELCVCDSRVLALLARLRGVSLPVVTGSDLTAATAGESGSGGRSRCRGGRQSRTWWRDCRSVIRRSSSSNISRRWACGGTLPHRQRRRRSSPKPNAASPSLRLDRRNRN